MTVLSLHRQGQDYRVDMAQAIDLSIPVQFDSSSLRAFGAPIAQARPLKVGSFIGDVNQQGSCNCSTYSLTPHSNGTHTECVGHITSEAMSINSIAPTSLLFAALISITPEKVQCSFSSDDRLITRELLQHQFKEFDHCDAVIVRTPIDAHVMNSSDVNKCPAYFSEDAMAWLASLGIDHLLTDLPSVDRMNDNGLLLAHRAFWGMPQGSTVLAQAKRSHATITEFIHVPIDVANGNYLLNLQVAPLNGDASPSRPLLYPLILTDS